VGVTWGQAGAPGKRKNRKNFLTQFFQVLVCCTLVFFVEPLGKNGYVKNALQLYKQINKCTISGGFIWGDLGAGAPG
jgi:hypothetical protein